MHDAARLWGEGLLRSLPDIEFVVEFGSRDVNGSLRGTIAVDEWFGIDVAPGPGVDLVIDAADWDGAGNWDTLVCTEVLEHTANWLLVLRSARRALCEGGYLILTCASNTRAPHSAIDGLKVRPGEYYHGLDCDHLRDQLQAMFSQVVVVENKDACDLYALAIA